MADPTHAVILGPKWSRNMPTKIAHPEIVVAAMVYMRVRRSV